MAGMLWYTRSMNTNGAGVGVDCRLTIGGVEYHFTMDGPLVCLPTKEKTEKRPARAGKRGVR